MLALLQASKKRSPVSMAHEQVNYRDANIRKRMAASNSDAPSYYKFSVDGVKYNGAKSTIHTLLDTCRFAPSSSQRLAFPYGRSVHAVSYKDYRGKTPGPCSKGKGRARICECKDKAHVHGSAVDEQIDAWCELLAGSLSAKPFTRDDSLLDSTAQISYAASASAYMVPDADACASKTAQYIWDTLEVLPMQSQFRIYSKRMHVATAVDLIGTSRRDVGKTIAILELKSSASMTMRAYLGKAAWEELHRGAGDAEPESDASKESFFTSEGCVTLPSIGAVVAGMPDNHLTRDLFQLALSVLTLGTEYGVGSSTPKSAYLVKACSNGIVCVTLDETIYSRMAALHAAMVRYEEIKSPKRKEQKKQAIIDKYRALTTTTTGDSVKRPRFM